MWTDGATQVAPTWAHDERDSDRQCEREMFREIDRQLRRIATRRAELDVEEARWLREAERQRIWRKLGFSTALEYLEDVFGHAPRTALERLRVAKELGQLPQLEAELQRGALSWSAARELTRVMTPQTEAAWLAHARGKNVHDISRLVAGLKKGDAPDAPQDPNLMTRRLVLELTPALDALFEATRLMFETERGEHLDDVALLEALCMRARESVPSVDGKAPKPAHRIVTYRCDDCSRVWREGRGRFVEIPAQELELAACDAELVSGLAPSEAAESATCPGNADESRTSTKSSRTSASAESKRVPTKRRPPPTLSIPKATRDFVWARDQGRCRVPGCRATRNLACHHVEFRSRGGDHDPTNIVLICDGHHKLLHDGLLVITGRAPDQLLFKRDGKPLIDARATSELDAAHRLHARV
jgi:hypothetical protein